MTSALLSAVFFGLFPVLLSIKAHSTLLSLLLTTPG
jgi:hypothetical protein